jgi:hypothetical protein
LIVPLSELVKIHGHAEHRNAAIHDSKRSDEQHDCDVKRRNWNELKRMVLYRTICALSHICEKAQQFVRLNPDFLSSSKQQIEVGNLLMT